MNVRSSTFEAGRRIKSAGYPRCKPEQSGSLTMPSNRFSTDFHLP